MLLLILGIIFFAIGAVSERIDFLVFFACLAFTLLYLGLACPMHGYKEPVLQSEHELVAVVPNSNKCIIKDNNGSVICKYENDGKEQLFTYVDNTKIVITEEGNVPLLKKYLIKPKTSVFAMAIGKNCIKEENVFYVPNSLIQN